MTSLLLLALIAVSPQAESIDLAGEWQFQLDPNDCGAVQGWHSQPLPETVRLPGSTDEQGLGERVVEPRLDRLTRTHRYVGPAWNQREVVIPEYWAGKHIELRLERPHWETKLWIDGQYAGMQNSLCVPHTYDLSRLAKPGMHLLTLRVDDTIKINVGHSHGGMQWAHSVTDETQTNWNGVIGSIRLEARPQVWVEQAQVYPDLEQKTALVRVTLGNDTGKPVAGSINITAENKGHSMQPVQEAFAFDGAETTVETTLALDDEVLLWDEFSPHLYTLSVTCTTNNGGRDAWNTRFGVRDFSAEGQHFVLNGRRVHLRGNLECCVFPLSGYPPMDTAGWREVLLKAQDYGLNHIRFHSWCPPEAAFAAADELGFMLQVEAPIWDGYGNIGADTERANFIAQEVDRIVDTYGNHPSFCLLSIGNELGEAKELYLQYLVEHLRERDPRHLYTCSTHPADWDRNDDYFVGAGGVRGHVTPDSSYDFRETLAGRERPLVAHEVGQFAVFPRFEAAEKYTGHLKAHYFEVFGKRFDEKIGLERNEAFAKASGALAAQLYKEEVEAQLRTPNLAGFQLLGLQDFPGQGVALIGMLDAFWDSKGIISAEEWRAFCSPTVALARLPKRTWAAEETLQVQVEVRHHGPQDMTDLTWQWRIEGGDGILAEGTFPPHDIPTGGLTTLGMVESPLHAVEKPGEYALHVQEEGGRFANRWRFWVYPNADAQAHGVMKVEAWNDEAKAALQAGQTVLLQPNTGSLVNSVNLRFFPIFWSKQLFEGQPDRMGILVDPEGPVFRSFPTRAHSDWQWYDLLEDAESIVLDSVTEMPEVLVRTIPDFNQSRNMSPLWQARVGEGRLLVCTLNLDAAEESPARRQFRHSLYAYMRSEDFTPETKMTEQALDELLKPTPRHELAGAPEDVGKAVLHVRAAEKAETGVAAPWAKDFDDVVRTTAGFDYWVDGGVWRDAIGTAWHDPNLAIHITCPSDFTGYLYVHYHDWNSQGRIARIFYDGLDKGPLTAYAGGEWLRFRVDEEQARKGHFSLISKAEAGPNVMVTEIVLLPEE